MIRRLGVRARLTVLVTGVFAVATTIGAIAVVRIVEDRLVDDTRANAEQILSEYLGRIYGGTPAVPTVQPDEGTSFFFLDENGREMSELDYREAILDVGFVQALPPGSVATSVPGPFEQPLVVGGSSAVGGVRVEPNTGVFVAGDGDVITYTFAPRAVDDSTAVDRGDDVVAIAQTFELPNGRRVRVGVSMPLLAVSDGLDAVRTVLWFAVPALTAAVAAITWVVAGRALRPVRAITARTQVISASNLNDRVPVPRSHDEVHELATTMNDMLARLDDSHRQQRQFVADASHELRSPVAASRVQLEVGLANPEATDWTQTATAVLTEQRHLGRLVDDLLALGRLDEGGVGCTADVDLDEVVTRESARTQTVPVVVDHCDPIRLRRQRATPHATRPQPDRQRRPPHRDRRPRRAPSQRSDGHARRRRQRSGGAARRSRPDLPTLHAHRRGRVVERTGAPASGWRSHVRSHAPTAARCDATTLRPAGHASASRSPRPKRRSGQQLPSCS